MPGLEPYGLFEHLGLVRRAEGAGEQGAQPGEAFGQGQFVVAAGEGLELGQAEEFGEEDVGEVPGVGSSMVTAMWSEVPMRAVAECGVPCGM